MDRERNKPLQDDTIFRIYSMSKPITSVALMMLFEEGRFQLNDPVHRFIPSWRDQRVWIEGDGEGMKTKEPDTPVSMRHVLSHSAGLTYGGTLYPSRHPVDKIYQELNVNRSEDETIESFAEKLAKVPLRYEPGTAWMYSLATDMCGCLVEYISGQPFEQFLKERIFDPLGMTSAHLSYREPRPRGFVPSHLYWDQDDMFDIEAMSADWAGGGLVMNARDLARFLFALVGGYLLTPSSLNAIRAWSETGDTGIQYGLGFYRVDYTMFPGYESLGEVYGHDGYGGAFMYFWPQADLVLSGTLNHGEEECFDQLIEPALFELASSP